MSSQSSCDDVSLAISLIDNTSLDLVNETEDSIRGLCRTSLKHKVAAVCVYPKWIDICQQELSETNVKIATVINFPKGDGSDHNVILKDTKDAIELGADEIDLVIDYRNVINQYSCFTTINYDDEKLVKDFENGVSSSLSDIGSCFVNIYKLVSKIKEGISNTVKLKVILETGELKDLDLIKYVSKIVLLAGADMIKTSTGKVPVNATPDAVQTMLEALKWYSSRTLSNKLKGLKIAGGVKDIESVKQYFEMTRRIMGSDYIQSNYFRFGASSLLGNLLQPTEKKNNNTTNY